MGRLRTYAPMRRSRPALTREVASEVSWRSGGHCEVVLQDVAGVVARCRKWAQDYHHVQKRSQRGQDDPDNVLAICRDHHDRTDWPYPRGRLVIRVLGQGRFESAIVTAPDKFAVRA
mgnify:FL=1